ncbi:hypothetical protein CONLIGDRAFT_633403 [Coniochaeta ligniaria NRRL 30616]|uniref:Mid2 domain-containing protein n=1 Tax=Coniochaeta ligniaria NRRL 30616 TaxID=1408157 RepID=A0A1J7JNE0_9PEZI|nr:hypothetical protein CONLIGDRAFT_633403 [Coniochaeta ligniaria NRRL 30616]
MRRRRLVVRGKNASGSYSGRDASTILPVCAIPSNTTALHSGFSISWVSASSTLAQTCVQTATSTSFVTVQCDSGTFVEFSSVTVPNTISDKVLQSYVLFAPLYQLNFKASDVPAKTTSTSGPTSSPTSTPLTLPTTGIPSQTSSSSSSSATETGSPTAPAAPTDASGLSSGAKAGIGVGVALGALLLTALAILFFRLRRRKQNMAASTAGTSAVGAGTGAGAVGEKGARNGRSQAELGSEEVRELDGRPVVTELPTRLPSDRRPPGRNGPLFRRSDQTWIVSPTDGTFEGSDGVVSPVEPHGNAIFELEGDTTPRSTFESRRRL